MKASHLPCIKRVPLRAALVCTLFASTAMPVSAAGDAEHGARIFSTECSECHSTREGKNKKGPSLFAVIGRKAASLPNVEYSDALREKDWIWDEETLRHYLSDRTKKVNPGSKMKYSGLPDPALFDDLLAYLNSKR